MVKVLFKPCLFFVFFKSSPSSNPFSSSNLVLLSESVVSYLCRLKLVRVILSLYKETICLNLLFIPHQIFSPFKPRFSSNSLLPIYSFFNSSPFSNLTLLQVLFFLQLLFFFSSCYSIYNKFFASNSCSSSNLHSNSN